MQKTLRNALLAAAVAVVAVATNADSYTDAWGPALGTQVTTFELQDETGATRSAEELMGARGLLVFYSRSVEW